MCHLDWLAGTRLVKGSRPGLALGLLVLLAAAAPSRGEDRATRTAMAPGSLVIRDVTVIPMDGEATLRDATVLVRDGRIASIGKGNDVAVPEGATAIDGRGKFLLPGLADMHVHLYSDDEAPDAVAPDELGVMLANGVTTIRLMIGTPEHLALRREIEAGRMPGPQLWIASPQFTGRKDQNARVVTTPDDARAAVNEAADAGYDFIKLTVDITPEVFEAIVAAARERKIPVVGHVDPRVGVRRALKAGQHIEHLDNYLETILRDDAPSRRSVSNYDVFRPENWASLDFMDQGKLRAIARETADSGTYTTPTLTIPKVAFALGQSDAEIRARPEWVLMPPKTRALYLRANERYWKTAASEERRRRYVAIRNQLVKEIRDAGGRIMAGSDAPEWFFGYGYTLHRELESLVAAGLSPHQALEAATATPGAFLNAGAEWGRIAPGMRADLVLLAANPLEDIRNTTRIDAVSVGGRWLDRRALDRMLDRAGERVGKPAS
ncbi:MAG: amidohydrolase family protein [Isosphaeraceae bacterium]